MKKLLQVILILYISILVFVVIDANCFQRLEEAAKAGDSGRLEKLLKNEQDSIKMFKALRQAVLYNHENAVSTVLKYYQPLDTQQMRGNILNEAIEVGASNEIVRRILETGVPLSKYEAEGTNRLLESAIRKGQLGNAKVLIEYGAVSKVHSQTYKWNEILYNEHQSEDILEFVEFYIREGEELAGVFGEGMMRAAVDQKDYKLIDELVQRGAKTHLGVGLGSAAADEDFEMVQYLIEKGVDIRSEGMINAIDMAIRTGGIEIVQYLLEQGAPVNETMNCFLLDTAVQEGNREALRLLFQYGADTVLFSGIDKRYQMHKLLSDAIEQCDKEMVRILLDNGRKVKSQRKKEGRWDLVIKAENLKKNEVDWFDFQHKRDYNEIIQMLEGLN